jgi:hypothetical protein
VRVKNLRIETPRHAAGRRKTANTHRSAAESHTVRLHRVPRPQSHASELRAAAVHGRARGASCHNPSAGEPRGGRVRQPSDCASCSNPCPCIPVPPCDRVADLGFSCGVCRHASSCSVILWGGGSDTNICNQVTGCSKPECGKCGVVAAFLRGRAGDVVAGCVRQRKQCARSRCSGHGRCVDVSPAGGVETLCLANQGDWAAASDHVNANGSHHRDSGGSCRCDVGYGGPTCSQTLSQAMLHGGNGV